MSNNKPAQSNDVPDMSSMAASRIIWAMQPTRSFFRGSDDLHMIFVKAVAYQGGPHEAKPAALQKTMEAMGVRGLTIQKIKSHLQKYREKCVLGPEAPDDIPCTTSSSMEAPNLASEILMDTEAVMPEIEVVSSFLMDDTEMVDNNFSVDQVQVSIFLLVAIVFTGAGFGYWMVRKFILSKDGSVDTGIAQFVKWAMRVVATLFIMQSTLDPLLALVALAFSWWLCSLLTAKKVQKTVTQKQKQSKVVSQQMLTQGSPKSPKIQFLSPSKIGFGRTTSRSSATQFGRSNLANGGLICSALTKRVVPNEDEDHYSTFHNIQPRKYSKEEWDDFTQESTRKALAECTATPEFAQWVADNARRLQVEKEEDNLSEEETIESSSSSEETGEEADGAPGLIRLWG